MASTNKLTDGQRGELARRVQAGDPYAAIARDLGITLQGVSFHARKIVGPKEIRKVSPAQSEEIAARFCDGERASELAKEFGVGLTTVRTHIEKHTGEKPGRNRSSVGVNPLLAQCDLAYLAGIVDGEGCISENRSRSHQGWQVTITNSSEDLRQSLAGLGGRFYFPKRERSLREDRELREQVWVWKIAAAWDVHRFLSAIEPYMRIKRGKALRTIADIERKYGRPPAAPEVLASGAAAVLDEAFREALKTVIAISDACPPLRARQTRLGLSVRSGGSKD